MRFAIVVSVLVLLLTALLLSWRGGQVDDFKARCAAAGGRVERFSNTMSGYKCIDPDGRLIELKGPGL